MKDAKDRNYRPGAEACYHRGVRALASDQIEDAVRELREAARREPRLTQAWRLLACVMEALGNPGEAMKCYAQMRRWQGVEIRRAFHQ